MARILVIEDEAAVLEMLSDELGVQGHAVIEARNGEEGLQKFVDEKPDLVLCDRDMPKMSGYDLLTTVREKHADMGGIPFVFLTALSDPRDKAAVAHLNPAGYIEKPLDFNLLAEKIEELLKK